MLNSLENAPDYQSGRTNGKNEFEDYIGMMGTDQSVMAQGSMIGGSTFGNTTKKSIRGGVPTTNSKPTIRGGTRTVSNANLNNMT